jgi:pheromone shutdown-related protein TraB
MNTTATPEHRQQPLNTIEFGNCRITLLGTAHVSRSSAEQVKALLATGDYDAVAVELCPSRYQSLINPESLSRMDLFEVIRQGKAAMVAASLALAAYQQRIADQFGIEPGAEMREAVASARAKDLPVFLIDREVGVTLKRIYRNVPWWQRFNLVMGLLASLVTRDTVNEEEVERLKEGDVLETTFAQFATEAKPLYLPLIEERDRYMAARLRKEIAQREYRHLLGVIGAGHLRGVSHCLAQETAPAEKIIAELDQTPTPSRWPQVFPWLVVALVLTGFVFGFYRSPDLGWQLIKDWIIINGGLAALGSLIAGAHPLTILGAFAAAPLTSLNPTIGAGMVTAALETLLRRPTVGDFKQLRQDTTHLKGWWHNRVTRILLVFLLSTLGSAIGTYVAGFKIIGRLTG